jgi:hypothetical protein
MRVVSILIVAVTAFVVAAAFNHPVEAAQPPRVASHDCQALAAGIGKQSVWQTTFSGWRKDIFGKREDIFVAPCFASEAECTAWLYWAQTDWPHNFYQHPPCQKGIR